jgi:pimeloyl-ACP methyl ester carboxylesterase
MPYVTSEGFRLHYQTEGRGPALVLHHGFTLCLEDWYEHGYVSALRETYHLILLDALGHGESDKPHEPSAYPLNRQVAHVTAVLDDLDIDRAHFWGFSLGGGIGFGIAKFAPQRVNALVIGGQHPYFSDRSGIRQFLQRGLTQGPDAFIAESTKILGPVPSAYENRLRHADLEAWMALMAHERDDMTDVLPTMTMPCCIYAGGAEASFAQAKLASEHIPNACVFSVPELTHMQVFYQSGKVLPHVTKFLEEVAKRI